MGHRDRWVNIAEILDAGGKLHVVTQGHGACISSLESDGQMVCMTETAGAVFTSIMDEIEVMAKRFNEEGIVTDHVNGTVSPVP